MQFSFEYHITWKMTLDLEAVQDGGLQILSTFEGPTVNAVKFSLKGLNGYQDYTLNAIKTAISNMDDLRKALAEDLKGQQGLCLPAGGVFFFKNPILGHKGDLICSISYNDTPSAEVFNPETDTVLNSKANERANIAGGNRTDLPAVPGPQQVQK
jgi:hypothetical protein